ncbi:DUF4258 domain-containing protein [Chloroflexota bacterium]|nr:DUF4258 domain-containing protein [Chloroflexota bacterium]
MKTLTIHATKRAAQRNLSKADLEYVIRHGTRVHKAGACFYFLGGKDIPPEDRKDAELARLEGTTVVLDPGQKAIVTVYRNRTSGLKGIRHKQDYLGVANQF